MNFHDNVVLMDRTWFRVLTMLFTYSASSLGHIGVFLTEFSRKAIISQYCYSSLAAVNQDNNLNILVIKAEMFTTECSDGAGIAKSSSALAKTIKTRVHVFGINVNPDIHE